jgi:hypothetical protein
LAQIVSTIAAQEARVCAAHGDFAHWNMYRDGNRLWLIDWEFSAPDAPGGADRLRFLLSEHTRAANRQPERVVRRIEALFDADRPEGRAAALQALAFLHARQVREAKAPFELMAGFLG